MKYYSHLRFFVYIYIYIYIYTHTHTLVCKISAFEIYIPYVYTFCISVKYLMTAMGPFTEGR